MQTLLFAKSYDLFKEISMSVEKFPKRFRYSLGLRLEENSLLLLERIIEAERKAKFIKIKPIEKAATKAEILKVLLRLSLEKKLIKETFFFQLQARLLEISKMLAGWRKSQMS